jgi:hypothetical protein
MDRRLGIGLTVALGAALLAIAFLLGRDSRPTPAAAPVFVAMPSTAPPAISAPTAAAPADTEAPPAPPAPVAPAPLASAAPTAAPAATSPAGPTDDPMGAEVARYFAEVEALQAASKGWSGDPNTAAQQILKETVEGQGGGFDALVEANQRLLARLRAVQAPAPCAPHLRRTIETVEQANALLTKMRTAIRSGNQAALLSLVAEGQEVERRARETDALAAEIKQPYGL